MYKNSCGLLERFFEHFWWFSTNYHINGQLHKKSPKTFRLFKLTKPFCLYLKHSIDIDKNNEHQWNTLSQLFKIRKIIRNKPSNERHHYLDRQSNIKIVENERIHMSISGDITIVIVLKLVSRALSECWESLRLITIVIDNYL